MAKNVSTRTRACESGRIDTFNSNTQIHTIKGSWCYKEI